MKAAEFEYIRAAGIAEVCDALAGGGDGDERKIIAGGQTLVPLMAMRLARPSVLIDINEIDALKGISVSGGVVAIRAGTRQRQAEFSPEVAENLPLLAKAIKFVGHTQTRNRGTVGGSIVHGDPSAEIALTALTLDAELVAQSKSGETTIPIDGFFEAAMVTALPPDHCLTEIRFPIWAGERVGAGFHEVSSRRSDFAVVAAGAQVQLAADGTCARVAVSAGGVAPTPVRLRAVETALTGAKPDPAVIREAVTRHIDEEIDPDTDLHATAEYRRRVARVMVERAILNARREASA